MKLIAAHVKEYKSIWDSNRFEIGDITCLVGKNEAGKTALLEALCKLNPITIIDSEFNTTDHYPRAEVSDYEGDVIDEKRLPATVIEGTFELDTDDLKIVEDTFGENALKVNNLTLSRCYPDPNNQEDSTRRFHLDTNGQKAIKYFIQSVNIPTDLQKNMLDVSDDSNIREG